MKKYYQEYLKLEKKKSKRIVIMKDGDSYEVYGPKAQVVAKVLNLGLSKRRVGIFKKVDFTGFTEAYKEDALQKLSNEGYKYIIKSL